MVRRKRPARRNFVESNSGKRQHILTVGHSTHSFEQFASLLEEFGVETVADIRRYPGSRRLPHFNGPALRALLKAEVIEYVWLEGLGGRRNKMTAGRSPNTGLKSQGFRNYADYMATDEFRGAVERLLSIAGASRTAVMCAEKLYWKCHRRLLSDYLTACGVRVGHIVESGRLEPHRVTGGAVITDERMVIYPAPANPDTPGPGLFEP
jgi:uncharacterized protein (DUF488 family)